MYAVIETGGKQYRVEVGTELEVELLDVEPGKTVTLDRVLLIADGDEASIGQPIVAAPRRRRGRPPGPRREARRRSSTAQGAPPRQEGPSPGPDVLRITDITLGGRSAAKDGPKAERDARPSASSLEEAAGAGAARQPAGRQACAASRSRPKKATAKARAPRPTDRRPRRRPTTDPAKAEAAKPGRTKKTTSRGKAATPA